MSKPIIDIELRTIDGKTAKAKAVVDTGSYYTIIREDKLPTGAQRIKYLKPQVFATAEKKGQLHIKAVTELILVINAHPVMDSVLISSDLKAEFILGAKTMQAWDITVKNRNGKTTVVVGRDMNDPEIQTVL